MLTPSDTVVAPPFAALCLFHRGLTKRDILAAVRDIIFVGSPIVAAILRLAYIEELYRVHDEDPLWACLHASLLLVQLEVLCGICAFAFLSWRKVSRSVDIAQRRASERDNWLELGEVTTYHESLPPNPPLPVNYR
jgi:hypothetical protein